MSVTLAGAGAVKAPKTPVATPPKGEAPTPPKAPAAGKDPRAVLKGVLGGLEAPKPAEKTLFLQLDRQAEVRDLNDLPVGPRRREEAIRRMREIAGAEQEKAVGDIRKMLEKQGLKDATVDVAERLWITNALVVKVGGLSDSLLSQKTNGAISNVADLLKGAAGVQEVVDAESLKFATPDVASLKGTAAADAPAASPGKPNWNLKLIGAPAAWEQGITGAGVTVANIDSGVNVTHPTLWAQYRGHSPKAGFRQEQNYFDAYAPRKQLGEPEKLPVDYTGHGTHTMGTIVGNDHVNAPIGVAPGATFIAAAGLGPKGGDNLSILKAMQFVTAPGDNWGQIDPKAGAHIVNQSWGGNGPRFAYTTALRNMAAAGIVNVFAAGNNGRDSVNQNLGDPALWEDTITVGAVDRNRQVAEFSSKGPSPVTNEFKPFVVAPGKDIPSAVPIGKQEAWSGTSMAAPHVTGALALVNQALAQRKQPFVDLDDAKFVLQHMAKDVGKRGPDDASGYGMIDLTKMDAALDALVAHRKQQ